MLEKEYNKAQEEKDNHIIKALNGGLEGMEHIFDD